MINPDYIVNSDAELRALFPPTHDLAAAKSMTGLDKHARDFIARSPFLCVGTQTQTGAADVSPRGDPAGFVQVLDDRTILIPDRPGNNRLDTQANIVAHPAVGLLFLIPGFDETLRINGQGLITTDPDLLVKCAVNDRLPRTAIIVQIEEVFLHCAKAFRRSHLWDPAFHQDRSEMPSLMNIMLDQVNAAPDDPKQMEQLDQRLEESYKKSMY